MNKLSKVINYLKAKKAKDKKQLFIQCIVGLSLGLTIGFMLNKQGLEKTCKKSLQMIEDDINRKATFRAMDICGFQNYFQGCIGVKEKIIKELNANREISIEEKLCSYLIEK